MALVMNTLGTELRNKAVFLSLFSVAMGFMEASVVVYLRQLYYPEGFSFPLKPMALEAFSLESLRELSTIMMLICVGIVAGRNSSGRLAWGLYCFGVWDIFYYVWLKALLNWPPSLLTWDILFLIPVVWCGPVLAPIICSATMVMIAWIVLIYQRRGIDVRINITEWALLLLGALAIVAAFVWEYAEVIIKGGFLGHFMSLGENPHLREVIALHIPKAFNWPFFLTGEGFVVLFVILFWKRMGKQSKIMSVERVK